MIPFYQEIINAQECINLHLFRMHLSLEKMILIFLGEDFFGFYYFYNNKGLILI